MSPRLLPWLCLLAPLAAGAADREWRFRVFLDDKAIGYHSFTLEERDGNRLVNIEADFEYKLLFLSLYEYSHRNTELWSGGCLQAIEATTVANGTAYELRGRRSAGGFQLTAPAALDSLPPCVMTFAYWNPSFLEQERLLDPQTGRLLDVEVSDPSPDRLSVNGNERTARRYRLEAEDLAISLWYSGDDEWLGLEADAPGGRTLRYERM